MEDPLARKCLNKMILLTLIPLLSQNPVRQHYLTRRRKLATSKQSLIISSTPACRHPRRELEMFKISLKSSNFLKIGQVEINRNHLCQLNFASNTNMRKKAHKSRIEAQAWGSGMNHHQMINKQKWTGRSSTNVTTSRLLHILWPNLRLKCK